MNIVQNVRVQLHKLFVVIFLLSVTGCSVKYQLTISSDKISEKIIALDDIGNMSEVDAKNIINGYVDSNMGEGGILDNGYSLKQIVNNENYGLQVELNDISKYDLTFNNNCFEKFSIQKIDDYYELKTSGKFKCLNVWNKSYSVLVNIKIDGKIIETNADSNSGKELFWTISSEDGNELYVKYKLSPKSKVDVVLIITIIVVVIAVICAIIYLVNRNKKENEL